MVAAMGQVPTTKGYVNPMRSRHQSPPENGYSEAITSGLSPRTGALKQTLSRNHGDSQRWTQNQCAESVAKDLR